MTGFMCMMLLFSGFPGETDSGYRFMYTCRYHGEWIETDDAWFGLFETDSTFELLKIEIQLDISTAPLYEGERPDPIVVKIVDEPQWPMIILSSSEMEFTQGTVAAALASYQLLLPDTSLVLVAPGIQETLLTASSDGLLLTDHVTSQLLSDTYTADGYSIGITWAGDLDRDGKVDLLINDVNDGYYRYNYCLFLSSVAGQDSLVKMVASFRDVYY